MNPIFAVFAQTFNFITQSEYKWTVLFYGIIILLLFLNRKKFDFEMKIVAILRTGVGLKLMNKLASKYREIIKIIGYCGIGIGYAGMIFVTGALIQVLFKTLFVKGTVGAAPVIPGVPIAGTGIVIPLVAGWLALFIIVVVHEFSHGVVARVHNIKIKSSGIAFFGPLLAAFVEPDEKQLDRSRDTTQYSMLAAGPFSNLILAGLVFALMFFALNPLDNTLAQQADGVQFSVIDGTPVDEAGIPDSSVLYKLGDERIRTYNQVVQHLRDLKPNDSLKLTLMSGKEFDVQLTSHPRNESVGYLGVSEIEPFFKSPIVGFGYGAYQWFLELLFWIFFLSFNIGLINLFPIFITDGAKMLKVNFDKIFKDEKKSMKVWVWVNKVGVFLLLLLLVVPLFRWIFGV